MFDALFCYLLRCPLACLKTRQANLQINAGRFHMIKFILSNLKLLENGLTRNQQFYLPFEHIPKTEPCRSRDLPPGQ